MNAKGDGLAVSTLGDAAAALDRVSELPKEVDWVRPEDAELAVLFPNRGWLAIGPVFGAVAPNENGEEEAGACVLVTSGRGTLGGALSGCGGAEPKEKLFEALGAKSGVLSLPVCVVLLGACWLEASMPTLKVVEVEDGCPAVDEGSIC